MPAVFRQQYTRPVPPGAERVTHGGRPAVRYRGRDGKPVVAVLTERGDRCRVESAAWYGTLTLPDGSTDRIPLARNKAVAEEMLRGKQAEADRARHLGVPLGRLTARSRPLADWLGDYEAAVRAGSHRAVRRRNLGRPAPAHVAKTLARVRALVAGCGFVFPGDVNLGKAQAWLDARQSDGEAPALPPEGGSRPGYRPGELARLLGVSARALAGMAGRHGLSFAGNGRARRMTREDAARLLMVARRGNTERTASYYAREAKTFTRWLVQQGALPSDPLAHLPGATLQPSHRHDRRALEEEEVSRLLEATRASGRVFRGLSGGDRHALYLCALSTGFRAGELASLPAAAFRLDDRPPVVLLGQEASKNGEGAVQPLPGRAADELRVYLAGRPPAGVVWPGLWVADAAAMLRADLAAAGVPYVGPGPDGDEFVDFHGLRHSFIARLDRAGVPLKTASELARHSTVELTAKVYARPRLKDLSGAVNLLDRPAAPTAPAAGRG